MKPFLYWRKYTKLSRAHRLWLGVGTQSLFQIITAGREFILVPLFLLAWGAEGYGRWLSILAAVSYLSLLDLGGQNYIANLLAMEQARKDEKAFRRILSESVSFYVLVSSVVFVIVLVCLFIIPSYSSFSNFVPIGVSDRWVVGIIATLILISVPSAIYQKVYQSSGLFPRGGMIANSMLIFSVSLLAIFLYARVSPPIYAGGMLLSGTLTAVVIFWDSRRCIPGCHDMHIGLVEARRGALYLKGSIHFWVISLGQTVKLQGVVLILAAYSSPEVVALFVTHRLFSNAAGYVGTSLHVPLWPELTFLWGEKQYDKLKQIVLLSIKLVIVLGGGTSMFFWVAGPIIYPIWTGAQLQFQPVLLAILMLQGILLAGSSVTSWSLLATNHHRVLGVCFLANALLTIGLSFLLVKPFGVEGVAVAVLIGDMVFGFFSFPILVSSLLDIAVSKIYFTMFASLAALMPLAGAAGFALTYWKGWWSIIWLLIFFVALAYPIFRIFLEKKEREQLIHWLSGLRVSFFGHQSV